MNRDLEERVVRERAHALWEAEGRPEGRQEEHWYLAVRELSARAAAPKTSATAPRRRAKTGARSKAA
jgi:hypothetical protein